MKSPSAKAPSSQSMKIEFPKLMSLHFSGSNIAYQMAKHLLLNRPTFAKKIPSVSSAVKSTTGSVRGRPLR